MEERKQPYSILFVCLGNICRSPAAEGVMRALVESQGMADKFVIDSAGTGDYHIGELPDPRMRRRAALRGYNLTHRCRQVCSRDFADFDLIIGMDGRNVDNLRRMAPGDAMHARIAPIGRWLPASCIQTIVPDPYYGSTADFDLALDLLEAACQNLLDDLKKSAEIS